MLKLDQTRSQPVLRYFKDVIERSANGFRLTGPLPIRLRHIAVQYVHICRTIQTKSNQKKLIKYRSIFTFRILLISVFFSLYMQTHIVST